MTNGARHKETSGNALIKDTSIPMNGSYQLTVIDRKTKQKYTIRLDVVSDAIRGCPVRVGGSVRQYREKKSDFLLEGMKERKERLYFGIEKLF